MVRVQSRTVRRSPALGSPDRDKVLEAFERLRTDALDEEEVLDAGERRRLAVGDDRLGGDGADSGQGLQGRRIRRVEIDLRAGPAARGVGASPAAGRA
ncbi:Uncharacterised protein [Mycobacteroides abscessus subsp. abscessus]|nr:Uncharacterised protein [Mycobacteroides abscessus subsp. abscessus]